MTVNQSGTVQTNPKRGSVASCGSVGIIPVTFKELWDNYEDKDPPYQVNGKVPKGFENQCAIRMSKTFHNVGVKMISFSQNYIKPEGKAPTLGRVLLDGMSTATRANELAKWLDTRPICGVGPKQVITGQKWKDTIAGKTGIIFFICLIILINNSLSNHKYFLNFQNKYLARSYSKRLWQTRRKLILNLTENTEFVRF